MLRGGKKQSPRIYLRRSVRTHHTIRHDLIRVYHTFMYYNIVVNPRYHRDDNISSGAKRTNVKIGRFWVVTFQKSFFHINTLFYRLIIEMVNVCVNLPIGHALHLEKFVKPKRWHPSCTKNQ